MTTSERFQRGWEEWGSECCGGSQPHRAGGLCAPLRGEKCVRKGCVGVDKRESTTLYRRWSGHTKMKEKKEKLKVQERKVSGHLLSADCFKGSVKIRGKKVRLMTVKEG